MITKFITILFFLGSASILFAQDVTRTLISNDISQLFINGSNPYGKIPASTVEKYFSENSKLYFFEIKYNNVVVYREGIKKSIPQSTDLETMRNQSRFKYDILIDASLFTDADKLKLLEFYKNKIVDIAQKKLISLKDFEIIKKNYSNGTYEISRPLENMEINIYKIEL